MITCRELADCLFDLVADEVSPEQRTGIDQHLAQCPPCVALTESYRLTIIWTRQLPPAPMPPDLLPRLRAALETGGQG